MATRKSNIIKFPQPINPERKDDVRMAEQFFEKICAGTWRQPRLES
jgi:hypothetical protein